MSAIVTMQDVTKIYHMGEVEIRAADGISFEIEKGEFAVIVGPSGAGKTTVLNILGGMDTCDGGKVIVDGEDISGYRNRKLTTYRRNDIGFVFQFYNLVQNLTALENVELAAQICKNPLDAATVLQEVGLSDLTKNICAEYGEYNIQCNGIGPGYIATPQTEPLREIQPDGSRHPFDQFIIAKTPAARWGNPEDLMGPAIFLASDASDFVNGQILYVDGGILAYIGKQPK